MPRAHHRLPGRVGHPQRLPQGRAVPGTCWSEGEEGTCGVAAVLTSKAPVTVHKRDHFRAAFIGLTCTAAPVFDPLGELLGVVDVSALQSPDDRRSQHLIRQLVEQTAREIENAFFMHSAGAIG